MKKRSTPRVVVGGQQRIRKLIVSVAIVGVFTLYSILHARSNPSTPALGATGDAGSASSTATAATPSDATPAPGSQYRDGTFVGGEADAQWGYVQVQAVIQAGKIAEVKFVEFPNDRTRSQLINRDLVISHESQAACKSGLRPTRRLAWVWKRYRRANW